MDESFYTPSVPSMPTPTRGSARYRFRQQRTQVNPLALRRLQLQDIESQRREEIAAGHQELDAIKEMARLEQQEYKIRQEIAIAKDVAGAQREVAKLDPVKDANYIQSYAEAMKKHPLAKNDKFLNEAFTHGADVFQSVQKAKLADASEEFKTKQHISEADAKEHLKLIGEATANGIDVEAYRTDSGDYDFNKIRSTVAANNATARRVIDAAKTAMKPKSVVVDSTGKERVTYESDKPDKPAVSPAEVFQTSKRILELQGRQETNRIRADSFRQVVNDPKKSETEKAEARKQLVTFDSDAAGVNKELDGLHALIGLPPLPKNSSGIGMGDRQAAESPTAIQTQSPEVPPVRTTAPVSGGTATPSGDMAPLATTTPAPSQTPATPRPELKDLLPY